MLAASPGGIIDLGRRHVARARIYIYIYISHAPDEIRTCLSLNRYETTVFIFLFWQIKIYNILISISTMIQKD